VADFTISLWLLKLGALANLYFSMNTAPASADPYLIVPAHTFFTVCAYRCLFPVRYEHNVVFHDSTFSSVFVTRVLATFSEVACIFLFSHLLRLLNVGHVGWVNGLSWLMVLQVVISQIFVWAAVLTGRLELYFYEEMDWGLIFVANTLASAHLYLTTSVPDGAEVLLQLNLLFGAIYLPFQVVHLRSLRSNARRSADAAGSGRPSMAKMLATAIQVKNRRTDAESWGGPVGLIWMTGYWATLIPGWMYYIVRVFSPN